MRNKKIATLLTILIVLALVFSGCSSKPKVSEDGYIELVSIQGNSNTESESFKVTISENRMKVKTTNNNKDGIHGQILRDNGSSAAAFSIGDSASAQVLPLKLKPGQYKIKVESTGTEFEISFEEKYTEK